MISPKIPPSEKIQNAKRQRALMEAFDRWHVSLVRYVYSLCKNYQTAEDIMQEVWVYVIGNFDEKEMAIYPFLRRKAYQKFIDHHRKSQRNPVQAVETLPLTESSRFAAQEPYTSEEEEQFEMAFWREFPGIGLSDIQKKVLWLHARKELTYKEISDLTDIPTSTISDWIKIARSQLASFINSKL